MTRSPKNADAFRRLHQEGLLILANVWDAGSARLIESLGAKALATTSAGVAWAHGYPDGNALPVPLLVATVAEIARAAELPLTVDLEGGYSNDIAEVAKNVTAVVDAGAVGINVEDSTSPPELLCAKIEAAKGASTALGVDMFVNARTDVYLRGLAPRGHRVEEVLARASRYRDAGADGLFVPGVFDSAEIRAITSASPLPVNVLAWPGLPGAAELHALGVRRLSSGSGIAEAVFGRASTLAAGFLRDGISDRLSEGAMDYGEINALTSGR